MKSQKAIVLLSGGLDSATTLAIAQRENYRVFALSFRYGQRHTLELQYAQKLAKLKSVEKHVLVDIDLRIFGGSALTDDIPVPKKQSVAEIREEIPVTYVPARNTIFLAFALAWAETLSVRHVRRRQPEPRMPVGPARASARIPQVLRHRSRGVRASGRKTRAHGLGPAVRRARGRADRVCAAERDANPLWRHHAARQRAQVDPAARAQDSAGKREAQRVGAGERVPVRRRRAVEA